MSTPADMAACELRDENGYPMIKADGAAIHVGRDCNTSQASGASIVWKEQAQKWLVPVVVLLVLVLTANALIMGSNLSEQAALRTQLRNTQVSEDLRKYETQQLRVQAEVNQELIKALGIIRECKK